MRQVVASATQIEERCGVGRRVRAVVGAGVAAAAAGAVLRRGRRPSEQAGGQGAAVGVGARVFGTERLEQVHELLAGRLVVPDGSRRASSRDSTSPLPASPTLTPLSSRRASAASDRVAGVSGTRASSGQGFGGLAPVDQDPGQGLGGRHVAGLELEGLAQRGLVAGRDQLIRLAGAGAPGSARRR